MVVAHRTHDTHGLARPFAVLLAGTLPLFAGTLLADWAYARSFQVQWINFADWLNVGGLVFAGLALVGMIFGSLRRRVSWLATLLLLATFVLAFVNALVHARDAWATMPAALVLSVLVLLLDLGAVFLGFSRRTGAVR